jgi:hypothetical protein
MSHLQLLKLGAGGSAQSESSDLSLSHSAKDKTVVRPLAERLRVK